MGDTKVETIARLAQWKIEGFGPTTPYKRSDPFKIGIWNWYFFALILSIAPLLRWLCVCFLALVCYFSLNWIFRHLSVEKSRSVYIRLFPEPSRVSKEQPPVARFVLRVTTAASNRRPYVSPSMFILLRLDFFFFVSPYQFSIYSVCVCMDDESCFLMYAKMGIKDWIVNMNCWLKISAWKLMVCLGTPDSSWIFTYT